MAISEDFYGQAQVIQPTSWHLDTYMNDYMHAWMYYDICIYAILSEKQTSWGLKTDFSSDQWQQQSFVLLKLSFFLIIHTLVDIKITFWIIS